VGGICAVISFFVIGKQGIESVKEKSDSN
jgi:hypothetical protein